MNENEQEYASSEQETFERLWDELQAVPSYVEQQAARFVQEINAALAANPDDVRTWAYERS